jgi:hypothetical protein
LPMFASWAPGRTSRQPKGRWRETGWNQRIGGRGPVRALVRKKTTARQESISKNALIKKLREGPRIFAAALLLRSVN